MASTIRVFNKWGELEDTIDGLSITRSWILNKYGKAEFVVPYNITNPETEEETPNPKLTLRNFQFGNFIQIRHIPTTSPDENSTPHGTLPDWFGVILPNRTWNSDGVSITAYSCEALLAYRSLPYIQLALPISQSFQKIIEWSNNRSIQNTMLVRVGNIATNSAAYEDNLITNAYDHIVKLIQASNMYWRVRGEISPTSYALTLYADLFTLQNTLNATSSRSSMPLVLTNQNTKDKDPLMVEQGTIINNIFAYTHASTAQDREMLEVIDQASFDLYGPFQTNLVFTGVTDISTLGQMAQEKFATISGPKRLFGRTLTDVEDAFSRIYPGATLDINEPTIGFNPAGGFGVTARVKIISISYDDTANEADLTIEVIQ